MLKEFYQKLLPSQGVYCLVTLDKQGNFHSQEFVNSNYDLLELIEKYGDGNLNVFVAPSSFKDDSSRKSDNVLYSKAFYLDLDVGPGKYSSKEEAREALRRLPLPPPIEVDSGRGIHAYWPFDQELPVKEWKPYAEKFKVFCSSMIKMDMVVTGDASRILRCPTTINQRNGARSIILSDQIIEYDFEEFKNLLGPIDNELDEDSKAVAGVHYDNNFEHVFANIVTESFEGRGCAQIKKIIVEAKTIEEPLWYAGLSIAQHCVDRDTAIHMMSEDDTVRYNHDYTEKKANQTQGKPQSCIQFENLNPTECKGCQWKGKITNPLKIGRRLKQNVVATAAKFISNVPDIPEEMTHFKRSGNSLYYIPPPDENGIAQEPVQISEYDIYPIQRMRDEGHGASYILMRYELPKDPHREFIIPTRLLTKSSAKELMTELATQELTFTDQRKAGYFMDYIIEWGKHMLKANPAEQMRRQMGWSEDFSAFVVGEKEFTRDGKELKAAASPLVHSVAKLLKPQGEYSVWQKSANMLDLPGFENHAFVMLCAFGSVLMRMTSTAGMSVGLVGGSGFGKTGALYAGLSLFGNPSQLTLAGGKDQATANGLTGWFLAHKNIMLGLDESSNRKAEELSNLIHQVSQGKGKVRMQASVDAVRPREESCSMICVFTENQSIYDKLKALKNNPDGEIARMFEVTISKPTMMIIQPNIGKEIFNPFNDHYGHAGPLFIKEVFRLGEEATKSVVDRWILKFTKEYGGDTAYRFYENLIGVAFAGGEIANNAGIINLDLNKIYNSITKEMSIVKKHTSINDVDCVGMLGEFQNKFMSNTLVFTNGQLTDEPKSGNLLARIENEKDKPTKYYVSSTEFKRFLHDRQINFQDFVSEMKKNGVLKEDVHKKRLATGWPGKSNMAPIYVLGFEL